MQSQKQNTLCFPPFSLFSFPLFPLFRGDVQFGFSLRLFNSSHIFFIDFPTPAFLWSSRSFRETLLDSPRFDGNYLLLLLLFWPAHKIDFLS